MSQRERALTETEASEIYAALVEHAGANARDPWGFVHHLMRSHESSVFEWRFMGFLGFGGKFYRDRNSRPDGSWGETWRVSCYPEDSNPEREAIIATTNAALHDLLMRHLNTETENTDA